MDHTDTPTPGDLPVYIFPTHLATQSPCHRKMSISKALSCSDPLQHRPYTCTTHDPVALAPNSRPTKVQTTNGMLA
ncbi:hypothetical protein LshimejAT787_1602440 [Lyophyllum shimeji]|uniref:Uncharacterized protein n=1 Tax=Lyophyllum shimeji TaxID=47721 RepID=A0A9P3PZ83_LYOSH|nr:hypothetical protein LshimejAT787_1602440 [Lyophyllum shimeji]